MNDKDKANAVDYFQKLCDLNGVVISSVSDGFVLLFKREVMQAYIDKNPDSEKLIIFVKNPGPAKN